MTKCSNCETEKTPMWRKTLDAETKSVMNLCNACGIYYKTKGCHRPRLLISKKTILSLSELFDKLSKEDEEENIHPSGSPTGIVAGKPDRKPKILVKNDIKLEDLNIIRCSNCENINTSIWRRDDNGNSICNACGLFYKKKGYHRAVKKSNEDMFLSIDENLIRFNKIKRRNRSTSISSESQSCLKKSRLSPESKTSSPPSPVLVTTNSGHDQVIESSPETSTISETSDHNGDPRRSLSVSSAGSQGLDDLVKHDIGNYSYNITLKPELGPDLSYTLPRIAATSTPITLPPISTILNIHK